MGRSPCCSKIGLNRGAWTISEDQILTAYIKAHGEANWRSLPKRAGLKRCGKSCRLRWLNYLKPGIKRGNISPEEEDLIIRLHNLLGNRWSLIAGRLPGRTDNEIKNYWNTNLSKRIGTRSLAKPSSNKNANKSKARKPASDEPKGMKALVSAPAAIRTKAHRFTKSLVSNVRPPHGDSVMKSATQSALNQIREQLNLETGFEADDLQVEQHHQDLDLLKFSSSDYQMPVDNHTLSDWTPTDLLDDNNPMDFGDLVACFLDQEEWLRDENS